MDKLTSVDRSRNMRSIKSKDSRPEMVVRSLLHARGYRFRLHRRDLPGIPDIVLPKYRTVLLVHGCFWHCHTCQDGHIPKSSTAYWRAKLVGNVARDRRNIRRLRQLGWSVLVVWECQTKNTAELQRRLETFLSKANVKTDTPSLLML